MTWSYDESEPTSRDRVRGRIGDIDTNEQLLSNETIDAILVTHVDETATAVECVLRVLAKIARDVDTSGAGMSVTRSTKTQHYRDLLNDLRAQLSLRAEMYVGGISIARANSFVSNTDDPQPHFTVGAMDNPGD